MPGLKPVARATSDRAALVENHRKRYGLTRRAVRPGNAEAAYCAAIAASEVLVENLLVSELDTTYEDLGLDAADASIIAIGERLDVPTIATLEHRDFPCGSGTPASLVASVGRSGDTPVQGSTSLLVACCNWFRDLRHRRRAARR